MKFSLIIGLACVSGIGCQLFEDRRDQPADSQTYAPLPAEIPLPTAAPYPPNASSVTPPGPTGWAENIPSLPEAGIPNVEVRPPSSELASASSVSTGPLREILAEGRKRRMERREERREESTPEPVKPLEPTVPPQPIAPPPLPVTMPNLGAPLQAVEQPVVNPAQAIIAKSVAQYAKLNDFEARFIKREVVKGKALPQDEILYRFRKEPLSVYMKILSDEGKGREVIYVKGQFDNDMHVITGKGDTFLGTGIKTTVEPDSRQAAAKSRRRIYEAGFGRALTQLQQTRTPIKALGLVKRAEWSYPLEGLELPVAANAEPDMPQGGVRRYYFDANEQSPSYMLPVLIITTDAQGKEIEYYSFTQFKIPSGMSNADWNPAMMGK